MRTIGNVLWFLLAGWWLALLYAIAGVLACVLIVTIPFGIAAFRLAGYALWPFGRRVVVYRGAGAWSVLGNILWIVLFGWELFFAHIVAGILLMLTIIGTPFGFASLKLSVLALVPLGTRVVDADTPGALPHYRSEPAYR
ncbi:MAG: YccF domain-containing protein [Pseudonocardiaceae bacterium]